MEAKEEFGSALGEEEAGRANRMGFSFVLCIRSFFFSCSGRKEIREPY